MNKYYITHILKEQIPEKGFRQVSFLTSNKENYAAGIFFLGYHGKRKLSSDELSAEIQEGKILRLAQPIIVEGKKFVWLDSKGDIWISDDNLLSGKVCKGSSGLRPNTPLDRAYSGIKNKLPKLQRKLPIHNL